MYYVSWDDEAETHNSLPCDDEADANLLCNALCLIGFNAVVHIRSDI